MLNLQNCNAEKIVISFGSPNMQAKSSPKKVSTAVSTEFVPKDDGAMQKESRPP